jgi:hypothetical protein
LLRGDGVPHDESPADPAGDKASRHAALRARIRDCEARLGGLLETAAQRALSEGEADSLIQVFRELDEIGAALEALDGPSPPAPPSTRH